MIAGRVTDRTGAIVVAVTITATADTGVAIHTRTTADGHYVLAPLVIGLYRVSIEVPSFRRAVSDVIQVHADTSARLDVQLELGAVNGTIAVRSPAPLLQTDTSSLSHTIGASQIDQLPMNGRNFSQLVTLAAGGCRRSATCNGNPASKVTGNARSRTASYSMASTTTRR
jgi:hypothetical protein